MFLRVLQVWREHLALEPLFWFGIHMILCWFAFQTAKHFYLVQVNFSKKVYIYIYFLEKVYFEKS